MTRIALILSAEPEALPHIVTDDADAEIYTIDSRVPDDAVYKLGPSIRRIGRDEFDALLAMNGPTHEAGDKPNVEQAIRAAKNRDVRGKPILSLVEPPPPEDVA